MTACTRDDRWYYNVIVGLVTFFGGLLLLLPCRIIWYMCCKKIDEDESEEHYRHRRAPLLSGTARVRAAAIFLISGQNVASKILGIFVFLCNMAAIVIYLIEASEYSLHDCGPVFGSARPMVYIGLCGVFTIHYIIRFIAATDKTHFWLDVYSIVDHFTIGPTFMSLYLDSNWLGLRFLRLLYLLQLPEVLQMLHMVKSSSKIRLTQIASIFIAIWLCSAGFVHLVENNGDPFHNYDNGQDLHYWECVYWLLITMSTVGFGDISPKSDVGRLFILLFIMGTFTENNGDPFHDYKNSHELGFWETVYWLLVTMSTVGYGDISPSTDISRAFIIIYIMGTFAMFTSIIPELARHLGHSTKYSKPYKRVYGRSHIVVCGHISYASVSNFIRNFIHEDTGITKTNVVFVDNQKPDLELEAYFKRHMNNVTFLQGSVMEQNTLKNVKLKFCEACLILANRNCDNPDEEDSANIMRATAVKNFTPHVRVIIQLLQQRNKSYLLHIPNWNWDKENGDDVICISELKLGLLAQNCLAPGVCTLMANLFTMRSFKCSGNWDKENGDDVICISELKLGLLAQNCLAPGVCTLMANLFTMRSFKITNTGMWQDIYRYGAGNEIYSDHFSPAFIGMSFAQATEVCFTKFNVLLLGVTMGNQSMIRLNPANLKITTNMTGFFIAQSPTQVKKVADYRSRPGSVTFSVEKNGNRLDIKPLGGMTPGGDHQDQEQYLEYLEEVGSRLAFHSQGGTGSSPKKRHPSSEKRRLVSMTSDEGNTLDVTGMFYWRQPRRLDDCLLDQDGVADHKFVNHVVLCLLADQSSPIVGLCNFIQPLRTAHIRRDHLKEIVIMTDVDYIIKEWADIASFPDIYVYQGNPAHRPDMRVLNLDAAAMVVVLSAKKHIIVDTTLLDKESILTALNVKGMYGEDVESKIRTIGVLENVEAFRSYMAKMRDIPLTVDLEFDENVAFLDQDDDDDPDIPLYMTHPYVSGAAFAASSLDSLLSATYVNNKILTLIRALITGGEKAEIEQILAEALGIVRKHRDSSSSRDKCHLTQLPLNTGPLAQLQPGSTYGSLFVKAIREYGMLCLGLYRLMEPQSTNPNRARKRYVITSPPPDFPLLDSDKVYCLQPYLTQQSRTEPGTPKKINGSNLSSHMAPPAYDKLNSSYEDLDEPTVVVLASGENVSKL